MRIYLSLTSSRCVSSANFVVKSCFFKDTLIVRLLLELNLILPVKFVQFSFVFLTDLRYKHSVVSSTTVLKKNGKYLPNVRDYGVLFVSVVKTFSNQLIKPNWVNKQCSVYSVYQVDWNAVLTESNSVDTITWNRILMFWFQYNAWNVKMLSVS